MRFIFVKYSLSIYIFNSYNLNKFSFDLLIFTFNIGGISPEVKRATIVGNPMYSAQGEEGVARARDDQTVENLGLDDLQMDYDQIMHYFHNLKV